MSIKFVDLPDTITPDDYAKWRGIGIDNISMLSKFTLTNS